MRSVRTGVGAPLLLVHGLGGSSRSWGPLLDELAAQRYVIAVDLPGFGTTPPLPGEVSIRTLSDALTDFVQINGLTGIDAVGSSMGARLVLELVRRGGVLGGVVSLDPGGFWQGWQRYAFYDSLYVSIRLVRLLRARLPYLTHHPWTRSLLLAQFSAHPSGLPPALVLDELENYTTSPSFDELLHNLAFGESQRGDVRDGAHQPLIIGWGRHDRVCFPKQAARALQLFPNARLHWFSHSGHFPHWDEPHECARLILNNLTGATLSHAPGGGRAWDSSSSCSSTLI